jgi:hypothetical protein
MSLKRGLHPNCKGYYESWPEAHGDGEDNYTPVLNGEELNCLYDLYGLGIFEDKDAQVYFGTCAYNSVRHTPEGLIKIKRPSKRVLNALYDREARVMRLFEHWVVNLETALKKGTAIMMDE